MKRTLNLVFALGSGIIAVLRFQNNILNIYLNGLMEIIMYLYIHNIRIVMIQLYRLLKKHEKYHQYFQLYGYCKTIPSYSMADRCMYNRYKPSFYIGSIEEFPMHTSISNTLSHSTSLESLRILY